MSVKREYKKAEAVRNWIRYKWIPAFDTFVFKGKDAVEILESSIKSLTYDELPYDEECCKACFIRLSKGRRLDMCRKVLKEMGYLKDSEPTFDRPGHAPGEE